MNRRSFLRLVATIAGILFVGNRLHKYFSVPEGELNLSSLTPDDPLERVAIYPGIGIARVGNSDEEGNDFYDGPEVDTQLRAESIRDSEGRLKRQAQRFRIYGFTKSGKVGEITADQAKIEWTVNLANKKADWYRFDAAMDIEDAKKSGMKVRRRNVTVKDRKSLQIHPGPRTITGKNISGTKYQFSGQKFMGLDVNLGELRTDEKGRLRVLGGKGKAGTPDPKKYPVYDENDGASFNNADGWYDDISDGIVSAVITFSSGRRGQRTVNQYHADPAWVIVGPPAYAPDMKGFRTFYDLLTNLYVAEATKVANSPNSRNALTEEYSWIVEDPWLKKKVAENQKTSFAKHIQPLLERMASLQWVNKGFADQVGAFGELDLSDKNLIAQLAKNTPATKDLRNQIFEMFRVPGMKRDVSNNHKLWPMLYGDAYGTFDDSIQTRFIVPDIQVRHLTRWKNGDFESDYDPNAKRPQLLSDIPVQDQPHMLEKAALDFCLADAFHPGCELTWPMRHITAYRSPFRILHRNPNAAEKDYGPELTVSEVLEKDGPLYSQTPGDLTKWMAIPWHGDTAFCRSGYEPEIDPFLPTFWPATVPNHVVSESDYAFIMDKRNPLSERENRFKKRVHWLRMLKGSASAQMLQMIDKYGDVGVIEPRPGPGDGNFPAMIYVENLGPGFDNSLRNEIGGGVKRGGGQPVGSSGSGATDPANEKIQQAGWESAEQLEEFRNIRFGRKQRP